MHVDLSQTVSGTGSLLIKKAIEFIHRRSFERVEVNVIAANSGVRHFYEAHGGDRKRIHGIDGVPVAIYQRGSYQGLRSDS